MADSREEVVNTDASVEETKVTEPDLFNVPAGEKLIMITDQDCTDEDFDSQQYRS